MIAARTAFCLASLVALGIAGAACGSSESSDGESPQAGIIELERPGMSLPFGPVKSASPADAGSRAAATSPFCNARAHDGGCAYIH
jgi:hypothetical protein